MSANRYLVVSDLHLCDVEDYNSAWKRHKSSAYVYDEAFDAMVATFIAEGDEDDRLTLILNGDIFDFDLVTAVPDEPPWPVKATERRHGLDATEPKSAWKLGHMLADHPRFIDTLARFVGAGQRVVLIAGNHDRELIFDDVAAVYIQAIREASQTLGFEVKDDQLVVEPWFYHVAGEIFVEHGHQYDYYSAFRYNLDPTITRGGETHLALPMGNLANRYLLSNIGTFNPHATDYILSLWGYISHWFRHYAFTRRTLILTWFFGSIRSLVTLMGTRRRLLAHPPKGHDAKVDAAADRYGMDREVVRGIYDLREEPITSRVHRVIREFWIDRLVLSLLMTGGTIALALSPVPLWLKLMVPLTAFPLLFFLYQWFMGTETALVVEQGSRRFPQEISRRIPVRAIVFGHTHVPNVIPLGRGVTFANSGTWAPMWGADGITLAEGLRNYVTVRIDHDSDDCDVLIGSWMPITAAR